MNAKVKSKLLDIFNSSFSENNNLNKSQNNITLDADILERKTILNFIEYIFSDNISVNNYKKKRNYLVDLFLKETRKEYEAEKNKSVHSEKKPSIRAQLNAPLKKSGSDPPAPCAPEADLRTSC